MCTEWFNSLFKKKEVPKEPVKQLICVACSKVIVPERESHYVDNEGKFLCWNCKNATSTDMPLGIPSLETVNDKVIEGLQNKVKSLELTVTSNESIINSMLKGMEDLKEQVNDLKVKHGIFEEKFKSSMDNLVDVIHSNNDMFNNRISKTEDTLRDMGKGVFSESE